ncbi:MAG TPA: hypothetical protein VM889_04590 [Candidatus Thermoplasmatota archaeon]|nr:hypothetical protein [Candidatus Thermoplasmatota archaeon]
MRALVLLVLASALAGCAADPPASTPPPALDATLRPIDVAPDAALAEEVVYPDAFSLADATPAWASSAELADWGLVEAARRVIDLPNGSRVESGAFVFATREQASRVLAAIDATYEAENGSWSRRPDPRAGDRSTLYRLADAGVDAYVANVRSGSVVFQVSALGPLVTEEHVAGWARALAARLA